MSQNDRFVFSPVRRENRRISGLFIRIAHGQFERRKEPNKNAYRLGRKGVIHSRDTHAAVDCRKITRNLEHFATITRLL